MGPFEIREMEGSMGICCTADSFVLKSSVTYARGVSWPINLVFPNAGSEDAYPLSMALGKHR